MRKNQCFCLLLTIFCFISACKEGEKEVKKDKIVSATVKIELSPKEKKGVELLEKCIEAHGGLNQWNSFSGLEYNLNDNGKLVYQITQLKDRRAYLKSKEYEVGFDGKVAWAMPNAEKVSGQSAAFYYNLDFYFVGLPFLLKDKGVNTVYAGEANVNGKNYESLKITFGNEVGLTPEDVYYLYIEPGSYILRILTYSISYFDKEAAKINSAKVYSSYEKVQGIMMPTKMENFEWDNEKQEMGKSKEHVRLFSDIRFIEEISDESIFEVPEGAVTEKLSE